MFEPQARPRVFAMPPGADFASLFVHGLDSLCADLPPEARAAVQVYVNTSRMQRRIREVMQQGPARLLPEIRLITALAPQPDMIPPPLAVSPLRRRLELSQLVAGLLAQDPQLAPRAALYDLSDSLAQLMDEMHGEGVSPDALMALDVADESGHWQRALQFLRIVRPFFDSDQAAPDPAARQRQMAEALAQSWAKSPPAHPIIVAGSTGSRGATSLLMQAVARLPLGAVVLPGFDFDLPPGVWPALDGDPVAEDHPQYRFRALLDALGMAPGDVRLWQGATAPDPARNRLISLSLRPAPVTSQWLEDGPQLGDLIAATKGLTLVEAASPRAEAEVIALRLRQAVQDGVTAALITPDRMLTRQVAAALDRWDIVPDDSAGLPLLLSPPGRFLRHVAKALLARPTSEDLLVLLKHPLCSTGGADRNLHLLYTRRFELFLRRKGILYPDAGVLRDWLADLHNPDPAPPVWVGWLGQVIALSDGPGTVPLSDHLARHIAVAEMLAAGPGHPPPGALWSEAAGREARRLCDILIRDADAGGPLDPQDYVALFQSVLNEGVVRDRDAGHPQVLFWGTLEARVQGADLVILGGLNDGVWPELPAPDPWLNRSMRSRVGLLLPERRVGLSAHDYQQAVAARDVWITRAQRSADTETVPSRWLNRLTNLLDGLPAQDGPAALQAMAARGQVWLDQAAALARPAADVKKAGRPSPRPPAHARPTRLSVTQIKTLVRDPFAIYAQNVLRLRQIDPLVAQADAPLRGIIYHSILEDFIKNRVPPDDPGAQTALLDIARAQLNRDCHWPAMRLFWLARLTQLAPEFLEAEVERRAEGTPAVTEAKGQIIVQDTGVTLVCKADRMDMNAEGAVLIYDYKTGQVPTKDQQLHYDKQLLLTAAMVTRGAFADLGPKQVADAAFLGITNELKVVRAPLADEPDTKVWDEFAALLRRWQNPHQGYTARMAVFKTDDKSWYDHLSRFGEWAESDTPEPVNLQ